MAETFDPTNTLETKGQVLQFYHTISGTDVSFKAFLEEYSETFKPKWESEQVFGRPDPIQIYGGTTRALSVTWVIPAFDENDAQGNLIKTSTLTRMLYPEYSNIYNASTISKTPLIKIKFANLIYDASRGPGGDVRTSGLLGVITNLSWTPDKEVGYFDPQNRLFPKAIKIGINFDVLHQHSLGWQKATPSYVGEGQAGLTKEGADKINASRESRAQDASPTWGQDAALFPWSAAIQRASTNVGTTTVQDIAIATQNNILGNKK